MYNQIFWLASYPKSGNTLLRSILISLFFTKDGIFELEKAKNIAQFDTTIHLKRNENLFGDNFDKLNNMGLFYKYMNDLQTKESLGFQQDFIFLKTHSGLFSIGESPFTIEKNVRGVIYILRDPRDVCISYSRHSGISIDEGIDFMTNDIASGYWVEPKSRDIIFQESNRPRSFFSSWDKHVLSWTSIKWNLPVLILKFEDLVYSKEKIINSLISFFETNYNFKFNKKEKKIENIIKTTSFDKLKKEEDEKGFAEATKHNKFFSVGKKNQWKNKLNKKQIRKLEEKFKQVMIKFKYELSND